MSRALRPWASSSLREASAGRRCSVESGPATTARPRTVASGSLARSRGRDDRRRGAVGDLRGVAGGDRAFARERRRQLGQHVEARLAHALVALQLRERGDLLGEPAGPGRGVGVRARGQLVLRLARDAQARVLGVGHRAHAGVGDRAVEAVVDHHVDHRRVAHPQRRPRAQRVRRAGHRVEAADEHRLRLAAADQRRREPDRAHARQAHVIERDPGHGPPHPALQRRAPPGVLPVRGLQHVADRRRSPAPARSVRARRCTACAPRSTASTFASAPL